MKKFLSAIIALAMVMTLVVVPMAGTVEAATLYEHYNTGDDTISSGPCGVVWYAQTFTTESPHAVTSVKLKLRRVGLPGTVTVSIRATDGVGHPTGTDLTSGTTDGDTLPLASPYEWREITLPPYSLTSSTKYAIVLRAPAGDTANYLGCCFDNAPGGYAGGNSEISSNSGSTWTTGDNDFMFEVYGEALPEVWVDDGWVGSTPGQAVDGHTFGHDAFATIQDGVDNVAQNGTVVHVAEGTYDEAVLIDGKDLTIQAASTPVLTGLTDGEYIIKVTNADVTLDGLTVNGTGNNINNGIWYYDASGEIKNCNVEHIERVSCAGTAVRIENSLVDITNNTLGEFSRNGIFVRDAGSTGATISGNEIKCEIIDNVSEVQHGIEIGWGAKNITIQNNTVYDTAIVSGMGLYDWAWSSQGIAVWGHTGDPIMTSTAVIQNNTVHHVMEGIHIGYQYLDGDTSYALISGNHVYDCFWAIGVVSDADADIDDNNIEMLDQDVIDFVSPWGEGIFVGGGWSDVHEYPTATITDNTIDNFDMGIDVYENAAITVTGNTITNCDYGIKTNSSGSETWSQTVTANFNNIYGNTPYGIDNSANTVAAFDATNNWWGENDKSGPYHPTLNPSGTGDAVSGNVTFDPWIGKVNDKTEGHAEGVTGGTVPANLTGTFENGSLGIGADTTTNTGGSSDVILVKYSGNPTNADFTASFDGSYYDLNVTDPTNVSEITLKLYYPATHGSLTPFWFNTSSGEWEECSIWTDIPGAITIDGVNYAGYVAVTINNSTTPSLNDLTGTYFALGGPLYTITASAGPNGSISPSGAVSVAYGSDQTFNITPDTGYHIVDVLVDGISIGAVSTYAFTNVTADHTISVIFAINTYTVNASAGSGGSISPSGSITINYGGSQTFIITPDTGYMISKILVDGSPVHFIHVSGDTYTFTNVTANHTISATFIRKPIPTFTVTASVSVYGGYATVTPKEQTVQQGSPASVIINPDAGYHISGLTDNDNAVPMTKLTENANGTYTYTIPIVYEDHNIVVTLEKDEYIIKAKAGEGGTISPLGTVTVKYNETETFTITPDSGYKIDEIIIDNKPITSTEQVYKFKNVKNNHTIEVTFVKIPVKTPLIITLQIDNPEITVNGISETIDAQGSKPIIKNDRTLIPIRVLIESLDGNITWNEETREVTINLNYHTIILTIDNNTAIVDGINMQIDPDNDKVTPIIINGRTYLPLRFIVEHLDGVVDWDNGTRTVTIYYWP